MAEENEKPGLVQKAGAAVKKGASAAKDNIKDQLSKSVGKNDEQDKKKEKKDPMLELWEQLSDMVDLIKERAVDLLSFLKNKISGSDKKEELNSSDDKNIQWQKNPLNEQNTANTAQAENNTPGNNLGDAPTPTPDAALSDDEIQAGFDEIDDILAQTEEDFGAPTPGGNFAEPEAANQIKLTTNDTPNATNGTPYEAFGDTDTEANAYDNAIKPANESNKPANTGIENNLDDTIQAPGMSNG